MSIAQPVLRYSYRRCCGCVRRPIVHWLLSYACDHSTQLKDERNRAMTTATRQQNSDGFKAVELDEKNLKQKMLVRHTCTKYL